MPQLENKKPVRIPLNDILLATDHFRARSIGEGGFGKVYKAKLSSFPDEEAVAIKRLNAQGRQGEHEFLNEIEFLSRFDHPNLISLLGFCYEGSEMILVYEFASKGSLEELLLSTDDLPWVRRLQICLDAARGLEYLHNVVGDKHRIIHRDIKCGNILLDHDWCAKISDFGLSKAVPLNHPVSHLVSNTIAGTPGYVDPQYMKTGVLKKESDVYSFGVVLLEVFCRELTNDPIRAHDQQLASVARKWSNLGRLDKILDPKLANKITENYSISNNGINQKSLDAFSAIIDKCLKVKQVERPTIGQVVRELDQALKLQVNGLEDLKISLHDIRIGTDQFDKNHCVGEKGIWWSYTGVVPSYKGYKTADIMRYNKSLFEPKWKKDYMLVLDLLFSFSHENIICLLGFSFEEDEFIIVCEYPGKGKLDHYVEHSYDRYGLTWKHLLKICIGAASGLGYLHNDHETMHTNIESRAILLNENWDAKISGLQFIVRIKGPPLANYTPKIEDDFGDPHYEKTGIFSRSYDVYSFGVVLLEVLSGRFLAYTIDAHTRFLWVLKSFESKSLEKIVDPSIMKQIGPDSLNTFTKITLQCLRDCPQERPTIHLVMKELEKALIFQENYEWEPKLPKAYKEIIKMANSPVVYSNIKELYYILYSGILLNNGHWFSLNEQGENCEMVPATSFSCQKRIALRKSRFPKAAKMLDLSNLNLHVNIKTEFLSPEIIYAAYLVFKFCDRKKITTGPIYVELKYTLGTQIDPTIAYFAEWGNNGWMKINLGHLTINKANADFKVLLVSMSRYYCGSGGIYIEGIEFLPVENEGLGLTDTTDDNAVSRFHIDLQQQLLTDNQEIIERFPKHVLNASNSELYDLLSTGILIDNGKKSRNKKSSPCWFI